MKIYLIGIGGIGVSALAQYYLSKGHDVSGSDLVASEITDFLKQKGIEIRIGQEERNITEDVDLVVYSPAVNTDNPEYKKAKKLGIKLQTYPEALGELTKEYFTIAVSGAHGKSTTTAMIALILMKAGSDPTVIVGTKVKEFAGAGLIGEGTNFRLGKSKFLVIEACEYDSSFLYYMPKIVVVTNVDKEHLDYFKNFNNVIKAFKKFIMKLPEGGFLVKNDDSGHIPEISGAKFKTAGYSLKQKEAGELKKILKVPGSHNVSNALAALGVARILGVSDEVSFKALSEFTGTWRRFQIKEGRVENKKITVVSDYGHHPNEISATLEAARERYPDKKIWCIFQPHQYQRTYYLFEEFVKTFRSAPIDEIVITDIYDVAGREVKEIKREVSSKNLVKEIDRSTVVYSSLAEAERYVRENIGSGDVLIIMGAGDIYKLADKF